MGANRELANADVNKAFWKNLLDINNKSHKCHGCDRHIPASEAKQFETYVRCQPIPPEIANKALKRAT